MGMAKTFQILAQVLLEYCSSTVSLLSVLLLWSNVVKTIFLYLDFLMHGIDINYKVSYSLWRQHDMCQVPNIWCSSQQLKSQNWYTVKGIRFWMKEHMTPGIFLFFSDRRGGWMIFCVSRVFWWRDRAIEHQAELVLFSANRRIWHDSDVSKSSRNRFN